MATPGCIGPNHKSSSAGYIQLNRGVICRACLTTSQPAQCQSRNHELLHSLSVVSSGYGAVFEARLTSPHPMTLTVSQDAFAIPGDVPYTGTFSCVEAAAAPPAPAPEYQYVCDDRKIRCTTCIQAMVIEQRRVSGLYCCGARHNDNRNCYPLFAIRVDSKVRLMCAMCLAESS